MTDIFDELNEDYRAERARALALRYGAFGGVLLLAVLAGVGGWQAWRWHQGQEAARAAMPFLAAMTAADALPPGLTQTPSPARAAAADAFAAVAATAPDGYRTLARLREAPLRDDAAPLYDTVAADPAADSALRDLATLLWAQRQVDGDDPAAAAARLRPLEAGPWGALARETEALLDLRRDDKDAAVTRLRALAADPAAAEGVRGRAAKLLGFLGGAEARG